MKTVCLTSLNNSIEANLLKIRLENEGIECFLANENFSTLMPIYNHMLGGGIQLIVAEQDEEKARHVLMDTLSPNNAELCCPKCGSNQIKLGLGKHKFFKLFTIFLSALMFIPMGNSRVYYICKKCKTEIR